VRRKRGLYVIRQNHSIRFSAVILWRLIVSELEESLEKQVTVASDSGVCGNKADSEHSEQNGIQQKFLETKVANYSQAISP
jgi:hypothetical protein